MAHQDPAKIRNVTVLGHRGTGKTSLVEAMLYAHPAIQEACVIGARDSYRGETVKAFIVLKPEAKNRVTPGELTDWARGKMAAFATRGYTRTAVRVTRCIRRRRSSSWA